MSVENKSARLRIARQLLERFEAGNLKLDTIVTCDEKWVMYSNVVRRRQWVPKGTNAAPTPKPEIHQKKILLSLFWDTEGKFLKSHLMVFKDGLQFRNYLF